MTLPRGTQSGEREEAMPKENYEQGTGQRLLIVEDELLLRMMMIEVLEEVGYDVTPATTGKEALEIIESGAKIDLLLTDVVMPGKVGGFELARLVREMQPNMPVIYTSGYTGFSVSEMGEVQAPLLQKPASPAELTALVAKELAGAMATEETG